MVDCAAESASSKKERQLFALLIGINQYPCERIPNLKGAVGDACRVRERIKSKFMVEDENITMLLDADATRAAIIGKFKYLRDDPRIQVGDPILIFYAGHGMEVDRPKEWGAGVDVDPKIQAIIPYDYGLKPEKGIEVQVIPDRTIGVLLSKIAKEKGNNITVIFDSCHSGSATRTYEIDPTWLIRGVDQGSEVPIDANLDHDIWGDPENADDTFSNRGVHTAERYLYAGLQSHVLLAACDSSEFAREEHGRGNFTDALLTVLAEVGSEHLTYAKVMARLPDLTGQHPRCEGEHRKRILFNAAAPKHDRRYDVCRNGDKYELRAGTIDGITKGASFQIYEKSSRGQGLGDKPLLTVVASSVKATVTIAEIPHSECPLPVSIPNEQLCAVQVSAGEQECLRLVVKDSADLREVCLKAVENMTICKSVTVHDNNGDAEGAHLAVHLIGTGAGREVTFQNLWAHKYGMKRTPKSVPLQVEDLKRIFSAAAHFFWNLQRKPEPMQESNGTPGQPTSGTAPLQATNGAPQTRRRLKDFIEVQFHELESSNYNINEWGEPILWRKGENLIKENRIDLVADSQKCYGITITSHFKRDLYVYLYYFDHSDLSIAKFYDATNEPLRPNCTLPIGYESSGEAPKSYDVPAGQDIDVGCLKLFVTNVPIDFSRICQLSPFDDNRGAVNASLNVDPLWDTALITLIQYRSEKVREEFMSSQK